MSSSSRSIAAARQKRAGEQVQKVNTSRPVTSISSQSAFAQQFQQQQQQQQQQMMNPNSLIGNRNVRQNQSNQSMPPQIPPQYSQQIPQEQITKISVSDAVGLITLRLGRLENIINESLEEGVFKQSSDNNDNNDKNVIPSNMKLVSDEVFENIANRINLLESKLIAFNNQLGNITKEMADMKNTVVDGNLSIHNFMNETNEKFVVYENALAELESSLEIQLHENLEQLENVDDENNDLVVSANIIETTEETVNENISITTTEISE